MINILHKLFNIFKHNEEIGDNFNGHPYAIITGPDFDVLYWSDYYHIIYGPEMMVEGIYWELEGFGGQEFHGHPFKILFNPKYKFERPEFKKGYDVEIV